MTVVRPAHDISGYTGNAAPGMVSGMVPGMVHGPHQVRLSLDEIRDMFTEFLVDSGFHVAEVSPERVVVIVAAEAQERRLGGTLSGPTIFKAADQAAFLAVQAYAGRVLTAVLVQGSISLLEAVEPRPLRVVVTMAKLGRRMAVASASVTDEEGLLIAVANLHFALPSRQTPRAVS